MSRVQTRSLVVQAEQPVALGVFKFDRFQTTSFFVRGKYLYINHNISPLLDVMELTNCLGQDGSLVAKHDLPTCLKQRTSEDKLWLALASLSADKRLQLLVMNWQLFLGSCRQSASSPGTALLCES